MKKLFLTILLVLAYQNSINSMDADLKKATSLICGFVSSPILYSALNLLINKPETSSDYKISLAAYSTFMCLLNYMNIKDANRHAIDPEDVAKYTTLGLTLGTSIIAAANNI